MLSRILIFEFQKAGEMMKYCELNIIKHFLTLISYWF
jgi:hypothetical protein